MAAETVIGRARARMGKVVSRTEGPGAVVVVNRPVHLVAAAAADHRQRADGLEFGRVVAEVDFSLFEGFDEVQRRADGIARTHVGHGHAVHCIVFLPLAAAGNRHGSVRSTASNAGREHEEPVDGTVGQRQFPQLHGRADIAQFGGFGVDPAALRRDGDVGCGGGHLQRKVRADVLVSGEFDVLLSVFDETGPFPLEHIRAWEQVVEFVSAELIRSEFPLFIGPYVGRRDLGAGNHGAGSVGDRPNDGAENTLGRSRLSKNRDCQHATQHRDKRNPLNSNRLAHLHSLVTPGLVRSVLMLLGGRISSGPMRVK